MAWQLNSNGVMRVITHANPSSELGQLIVDSLFGIDYEELGTEGPGVGEQTHMYEIRLLVETEEQAQRMHEQLRTLDFSDAHLGELGVLATQDTRRFELVAQEQADGVRTTTRITPLLFSCHATTSAPPQRRAFATARRPRHTKHKHSRYQHKTVTSRASNTSSWSTCLLYTSPSPRD